MIPGEGSGKGDSPRAADLRQFGQNFEGIDWRKGEPKEKPWIKTEHTFRADPYAGMNVHERVLKSYYDRECAGTLQREKVKGEHRRFKRAHDNAIARGL